MFLLGAVESLATTSLLSNQFYIFVFQIAQQHFPKTMYISLFLQQHDRCSVPASAVKDVNGAVAVWLGLGYKTTWLRLEKHCGLCRNRQNPHLSFKHN